ncbi:UvrD-helicase domain-containing protein [Poseidonibacter ostreae]|uniref:UvrD-helicase domain-containing protein n=1 Tax=Poseidonibacter ostreae TaxID=2654171 RepID=UPI00186B21C8|nr:ATP-dependent helicase [Poseidonibacter ostreae]
MAYIQEVNWIPQGITRLEDNANLVIRNNNENILVTAGPGAGKTELLAQKASFLLQTGACKRNKKILAISFKKDASKNLKDRVELRCGKDLSKQFDSITFDAFAKNIFDRFKDALPLNWRIGLYELNFIKNDEMEHYLLNCGLTPTEKQNFDRRTFEQKYLTKDLLPLDGFNQDNIENKAIFLMWSYLITNNTPSIISLSMINRLVELIFRTNPKLLLSLQSTYSFVFLDEFQDTTNIQYDLIKRCFINPNTKITAVGDEKQTIMGWAGALSDIFNSYESEFNASKYKLQNNYRSSPELVNIQNIITQSLMGEQSSNITSMTSLSAGNDSCKLYSYTNENNEANDISLYINDLIVNKAIPANEICLLTKQTPEVFTPHIQSKLTSMNIKSRIENELQDVLSESLTKLVICMLRLIFLPKCGESWKIINEYFLTVYSDSEKDNEDYINVFITNFRTSENFAEYSKEGIQETISILVDFLNFNDEKLLKTVYKQYSQGDYLKKVQLNISKWIFYYLDENSNNWKDSLSSFEGRNCVKIMTMHKSKGLEFNTVIFVGLEDNVYWTYSSDPLADNNGFFVAFSRAKERILFTISHREHYRDNATISTISPIIDIFREANINLEVRN